jgi:hypothetical protein
VKPSSLKIGDIIEFTDKSTALYVGKYDAISFEANDVGNNYTYRSGRNERYTIFVSKKSKEKRHFYIESYDIKDGGRLKSVQSIKIYQVVNHINVSQEGAYERINKAYRHYNRLLPILQDSVFSFEEAKYNFPATSQYPYYIYNKYPIYDIIINEQSISYKSCYNNESDITNIIWMTLGNSKICITNSKDELKHLKIA